MKQSDPFGRIPSPVLLMILKLVPDLPSLRALDEASPVLASLFDECGAEIMESVMSASLPGQIQSLIRVVALIRSRSVPSKSLEDFITTFVNRDGPCPVYFDGNICMRKINPTTFKGRIEPCGACHQSFLPLEIARNISPPVLRGILNTSSQIQTLTDECLQFYINRALALEPLKLATRFRYINRNGFQRCPQRRPVGEVFQPNDFGPPTYFERQITSRHFWRIQMFLDLKSAADYFRLRWSSQDNIRLLEIDVVTFWTKDGWDPLMEQFRTVVDYLEIERSPHDLEAKSSLGFGTLSRMPDVTYDTHTSWHNPHLMDPSFLDGYNEAYDAVRGSGGTTSRRDTPLRYIDIGAFRKFGFFIFDEERMIALGFLPEDIPAGPRFPMLRSSSFGTSDMLFRWESILDKAIVEANEARRIAEFPEELRAFGSYKKETYWSK